MGQAWCKEKSTKAQDSKSPLDRVFLRCAHRIYPGLKEEGSVLGGATQRVTSSEIGYASSPPREVLTRGQSIDSVDRPFHPSDWVDVNLEVPVTPRASSVMTNLTLDTTIYPPTTLTSTNSSGSNLREFVPIPPPRRRKKNRGRPLPPKPDEVSRSHVDRVMTKSCKDSRNSSHEPLYSSVKIPKNSSNEKEIYEHKVNGTGRIIPSIVVAASKSYREKSSRGDDKTGEDKNSRKKSTSTVSLPNYSELEVPNESSVGDDDGNLKEHKITTAGSLPALITSGALENLKKIDREEKAQRSEDDNRERKRSVDEVDFSFDVTKNQEALNSILKLDGPRQTSTPVKNGFEDDSRTPTTVGGWFLHQERAPEFENFQLKNNAERHDAPNTRFFDCVRDSRSEIFFEAEEDLLNQSTNNTRIESVERVEEKSRMKTSLKRTLSNESEPFDSCEEKELREFEPRTDQRSNSQVKLIGARTISEESLPHEMLENETDFFEDKRSIKTNDECKKIHDEQKVQFQVTKNDETKTPPPSPEPKIKPEIFDNDHSTLLKVLREEAEESNLSSMTPSLTELEAALSDMLEREDDEQVEGQVGEKSPLENTKVDKILEKPIEPKIVQIDLDHDTKNSGISLSLKNILGGEEYLGNKEKVSGKDDDDSKIIEINLTNGNKSTMEKGPMSELVEISLGNSSRTERPSNHPSLKNILGGEENLGSKEKVSGKNDDDSKMIEINLTNGNKSTMEKGPMSELVEISLGNSSRITSPSFEPPEKPSRLHQLSHEEGEENLGISPTPPKRKNRFSGHSTSILTENERRSCERIATPENPYPNDRLI